MCFAIEVYSKLARRSGDIFPNVCAKIFVFLQFLHSPQTVIGRTFLLIAIIPHSQSFCNRAVISSRVKRTIVLLTLILLGDGEGEVNLTAPLRHY